MPCSFHLQGTPTFPLSSARVPSRGSHAPSPPGLHLTTHPPIYGRGLLGCILGLNLYLGVKANVAFYECLLICNTSRQGIFPP